MANEPMQKVLRAIGLCLKAGRLVCGTPLVCEALGGKRKPFLVVEVSDNSANTAKRLADKCAYYGVEKLRLEASGEALASALGKSARVAAVAITDEQLSRLVRGAITEYSEARES
jgi:ribosomal protein L7Ae-like RNA K-turn-binding protein